MDNGAALATGAGAGAEGAPKVNPPVAGAGVVVLLEPPKLNPPVVAGAPNAAGAALPNENPPDAGVVVVVVAAAGAPNPNPNPPAAGVVVEGVVDGAPNVVVAPPNEKPLDEIEPVLALELLVELDATGAGASGFADSHAAHLAFSFEFNAIHTLHFH